MPNSAYNATIPYTGGGLVYARALIQTATNYTRTGATTWAEVDSTNLRVAIAAVAGDILYVSASFMATISNASNAYVVDAQTIVSGTRTNSVGSGGAAVSNSHEGIGAWRVQTTGIQNAGGGALYVVQAGDVVSGVVTMSLCHRMQDAAQTGTIFKSTSESVILDVVNLKSSASSSVPPVGNMFSYATFR